MNGNYCLLNKIMDKFISNNYYKYNTVYTHKPKQKKIQTNKVFLTKIKQNKLIYRVERF